MIIKRKEVENSLVEEFSRYIGISYSIAELLLSRGIDSKLKIHEFFKGTDIYLEDFSNANEASELIKEWVKQNKRFLVYGDYDADGVTSTVILVKTLQLLGANVRFFIPSRFEDGYGLSIKTLKDRIDDFDVIVTVDTGITAVEQVNYLKTQGKYVIITDHHVFKELPDADCIVHPFVDKRKIKMCGAFTALQLSKAILDKVPFYLEFLASVGTVADQMPLLNVNRNLVKYALSNLDLERPFPVQILFPSGDPKSLKDWQFRLIPMINSAGRIDTANYAVYLLSSTTYPEATNFYKLLHENNETRKNVTQDVKDRAIEYIEKYKLYDHPIIIVPLVDSHEGVNGIVASQILQKYGKPAIVLYKTNEYWVGSGRSKTLNIHETLSNFKDLFDRFGGHDYAVGMRIRDDNLTELIKEIHSMNLDNPEVHQVYDVDISISYLSLSFNSFISKFEPFGQGNPPILFRSTLEVSKVIPLKGGKFYKVIDGRNNGVEFLFWNPTGEIFKKDRLDVVYKISENNFGGKKSVSAEIQYYEKKKLTD